MPAKIKQKITDTINPNARLTIDGGRVESYWRGSQTKGRYTSSNGGNTIYDLPSLLADYKLKGFEFGNWLNQDDRADAISAFITSIDNLSKIVGSKNIGFSNFLGVAFGARGKSKALAHFEPKALMINFTKEQGIGSMAHEWAHALDFVLGRYVDQHSTSSWLSGPETSTAATTPSNTGGQLRYHVNRIIDTAKATKSHARLASQAPYWRLRLETFARLFEQYCCYKLKAKNIRDHYLAKPITRYQTEPQYISDIEFRPLIPMFNALMKDLSLILNNKDKIHTTPYHTVETQQKTAASKPKKPIAIIKPKPFVGKFNIYDYIDPKKKQSCITGVYHDKEHKLAVATDALIMIATSKDYNPSKAGQIIDRFGEDKQQKYPNYRQILPTHKGTKLPLFDIPATVARNMTINHDRWQTALKKERKKGITRKELEKLSYISVCKGKEKYSFNYALLQKFLKGARYIRADHFRFIDRKIYASTPSGEFVLLLSTVNVVPYNISNDNETYCDTIIL